MLLIFYLDIYYIATFFIIFDCFSALFCSSVDYIFIGFWLIGYFDGFVAAHFVHCVLSAAYRAFYMRRECSCS